MAFLFFLGSFVKAADEVELQGHPFPSLLFTFCLHITFVPALLLENILRSNVSALGKRYSQLISEQCWLCSPQNEIIFSAVSTTVLWNTGIFRCQLLRKLTLYFWSENHAPFSCYCSAYALYLQMPWSQCYTWEFPSVGKLFMFLEFQKPYQQKNLSRIVGVHHILCEPMWCAYCL